MFAAIIADAGPVHGASVTVRLDSHADAIVARLTGYSLDRLGLAKGSEVFALIKSVSIDQGAIGRVEVEEAGQPAPPFLGNQRLT